MAGGEGGRRKESADERVLNARGEFCPAASGRRHLLPDSHLPPAIRTYTLLSLLSPSQTPSTTTAAMQAAPTPNQQFTPDQLRDLIQGPGEEWTCVVLGPYVASACS